MKPEDCESFSCDIQNVGTLAATIDEALSHEWKASHLKDSIAYDCRCGAFGFSKDNSTFFKYYIRADISDKKSCKFSKEEHDIADIID